MSWWVVVIRIGSEIEGTKLSSVEEYSMRLVEAGELDDAKANACTAVLASNPDGKTTDGKVIRYFIKSVIDAEYVGEGAIKSGAEVWSRLAFLDRAEDRPAEGDVPPFWALRVFHTDWNVTAPEERI